MTEKNRPDDTAAMVALLTSFQQATQHADAKVSTLVAVHAGLGAVLASRAEPAATALRGEAGPTRLLLGVLAVLLVAFLAAGFHLYQALRPRIPAVPGPNRYALNRGPVDLLSQPEGARAEELRAVLDTVAAVARTKHRHVGRALAWTAVLLVVALAWLVLLGVAG